MKKLLLFISAIILMSGFLVTHVSGQENPNVITCSEFHITKPIKDIPYVEKDYGNIESFDREFRPPQTFIYSQADGTIYGNDPSYIQTKMGIREPNGKAIIQNWAGQTATGFRPFDPSGAAGPNHYIQMINSTTFRVYSKTGTVLLTQTLGNLWTPATGNSGDPIVLYDPYANRWFLSQFGTSSDRKIYIAISTTADPLGSYYTYTWVSPQFPDYLKFSIWENGYYMTSNQSTDKVFCFERSQMLVGNAGSRAISANFTTGSVSAFFCPLPADAEGGLPVAGTPLPFFAYYDQAWGGGTDGVKIWNMTVTWGATPTATISAATQVNTMAFDASYNASWNDITQPGTTQKLDGIGGVPTFRAQWRKWTGYNTVVLNWGVNLNAVTPGKRGLMWVELRQDQGTGVWSIYQQSIFDPDIHSRWMGSIAMDNNGSIALAYAKSSGTIYPSLCYTGRLASDPLNTMTVTEVVAIAGTSVQTGTNRFGDYSQTSLDPDGITFWHTGEYIASGVKTRVYSFQIPPGAPMAGVTIAITAGSNPSCAGASVTFTATPTNGGTTPSYQWKVNGGNVGGNSPTYTTTTLTNGQIVTCVMTSNLPGVIGNPATSNAITMTINPVLVPAVSIAITSGSNPSCAGASVTFTATPTNGGATPAYQWKVNGGNVGTNSATYTTTGLTNGQIVTCVLTSNATCANPTTATSNAITMTITASVVPAVSIAITAGTNPMCSGASITFTATPTNGGTTPAYQWKVNGGNVGTNSPTYTTTALTNGQIVTCVLTSNATCAIPSTATSNAITMTVNPILVPAVAIAITTGSNPCCVGASITFTATPTNGGTTPAYQWKINGGNVGTNSSTYTTTTLTNGQIVTCVLTSNATCANPLTATSNAITMTVNAIPPKPTITQNILQLTSSSATGNQWYLNAGIIAGATNQVYNVTQNGSYTVIVTINGCPSPVSDPVVITNVGIDEGNNKYGLTIYPNPNDGKFTVIFSSIAKSNFKLEITDALGQKVFSDNITDFKGSYTKQISLVNYGKGVYTLTLTNSKNETIKKIVVF